MNPGNWWGNFDKFLMSFFVVYFSLLGWFAVCGTQGNNPFALAMLDNEKLVIGALLGLITGRATARMDDRRTIDPKAGGTP